MLKTNLQPSKLWGPLHSDNSLFMTTTVGRITWIPQLYNPAFLREKAGLLLNKARLLQKKRITSLENFHFSLWDVCSTA
jgi:hypothetical protein